MSSGANAENNLRRQLAAKEEQLSQRDQRIASLEHKAITKDRLIVVQNKLGLLLENGEQLKQQVRRDTEPPASDHGKEWFDSTKEFLEKELGHATAVRFVHPPQLPSYSFGIPKANENFVNGIERHLEVLRQITKQLESDIRVGEH